MTGGMHDPDHVARRNWRGGVALGVVLLLALLLVASRISEIDRFVALVAEARPIWLAVALVFQGFTYVCLSLGWHAVLACEGGAVPLSRLLPVSLVKLFADQAIPSAGLGGHLVTIERMRRLGVPLPAAMGAVLLTLIGYYTAYALLAIALLAVLWLNRDASPWLAGIVTLFLVVASAIPTLALWLRRRGNQIPPRWLARLQPLRRVAGLIAQVPDALLHKRSLIVRVVLLNALIFLLDAATLAACLLAVGAGVHPVGAFCALIMASIASTLSPLPMGLGSFEATSVAMLATFGIGFEAALAATLLLRGLTLWLPLLPGLVLMRGTRHVAVDGSN